MTENTSEREALGFFLQPFQQETGLHSPLESALRDARVTMQHGEALWLATVGYFMTAEMLGRTVGKIPTAYKDREPEWRCFEAGMIEFAESPIDGPSRQSLWNLRCALVHQYSLRFESRRGGIVETFVLTQEGPICRPVAGPITTQVNVRAVGQYVEGVIRAARSSYDNGEIQLVADVDEVLSGGFFVP